MMNQNTHGDPVMGDTTPQATVTDSTNMMMVEWRRPDGVLHRDDGPARVARNLIDGDHTMDWCKGGRYHRLDGPARFLMESDGESHLQWYRHGSMQRPDGPSQVTSSGAIAWHTNRSPYMRAHPISRAEGSPR